MKRATAKRKAPPGWLMTGDQHASYWRLLADAAVARGLTTAAEREALRQELHQAAFGQPKSAKAINRTTDFDAFKAAALAISRPADMAAQLRQQAQPRRRREHRIWEVMQCLALYHPDPAGYVATLLADREGVPVGGSLTLEDVSDEPRLRTRRDGTVHQHPSDLEQVLMTLWARVQPMRRARGHTLHAMRVAAGVPCDCASICRPLARRVVIPTESWDAAEPAGPAEEPAESLALEQPF